MPAIAPNNVFPYNGYANNVNYGQPIQGPSTAVPNPTWQNQFSQTNGLSIAQISDDSQINSYPVAAGNTVLLINFSTQKFYLKSTNVNGVPMPIQTANWNWEQNVQGNQQSQISDGVSRREFEELKAMLAQALSNQQSRQNNQRYNKRGGEQNAQSGNDAANNG